MQQATHNLAISTRGQGLYEFTPAVSQWVERQKIQAGLLTVFCRHTSASVALTGPGKASTSLNIAPARTAVRSCCT